MVESTLTIMKWVAGVAYYLTMWYCRHEIQFRQALFFSAASVAGAFSGLLAFGISKMDGVGNLEGWRWIFILEGIATVIAAIAAFFLLHDFPETAKFLTDEERAFVVFRLKYQGQSAKLDGASGRAAQVAQADEFQWKYVRQAFMDWQIWLNIFVYWGVSVYFLAAQIRTGALTFPARLFARCTEPACSYRQSSRTWATLQARLS